MSDQLVVGTQLALGALLLVFASMRDLRTRLVPDMVWIIMGTVGFVLMVYRYLVPAFSWTLLLGTAGVYLVLLDFLIPRPEIFPDEGRPNLLAAVLPVCAWGMLSASFAYSSYQGTLMDAPGPYLSGFVIGFTYLMYRLGYIAGGADAKALMAISVLVPVIPVLEGSVSLPLIGMEYEAFAVFPFALLAFIYSGLIHAAVVPYTAVRNALKGDYKFPQMLFGYRMDVGKVNGSFVWPMERIEDGEVKTGIKHCDEPLDEAGFKKLGRDKAWVTPQHPGIVYLTFGFLVAFIVGNPFLLLLG